MDTTILQFLGGGAFAYVVIKEVFTFIKANRNGNGNLSLPPPLSSRWSETGPGEKGDSAEKLIEISLQQTAILQSQTELLRDIKHSNGRNGEKLEAINRNMLVMLERQTNVNKVVDEIRNQR